MKTSTVAAEASKKKGTPGNWFLKYFISLYFTSGDVLLKDIATKIKDLRDFHLPLWVPLGQFYFLTFSTAFLFACLPTDAVAVTVYE